MLRILMAIACIAILACGTEKPTGSVTKKVTDEGIEYTLVIDIETEPLIEEPEQLPKPEPQVELELQQPEQEITADEVELARRHFGAAVASLEERVYLADVIVRATLVSAAADVLTFTAVDYLKGSGPARFTVSAATSTRNTQWDGSEAILFLSTSSGSEVGESAQSNSTTFEFTDTTEFDYFPDDPEAYSPTSYAGDLSEGFTIDSANPVWTPAEGSTSEASGASGDSSEYIASSETTLGEAFPTFTLEELRERIAWLEGGEGIEGYDECISFALRDIRYWRDLEAFRGEALQGRGSDLHAESGVKDVDVMKSTTVDIRSPYAKVWLEGEDAKYFSHYIVDDDTVASNGYSWEIAAVRPLPAGSYKIRPERQHGYFHPCNYHSEYTAGKYTFNVIVTAPEGTVFEAFFDPDTTGYGSGGGELDPATFTVGGTNVTISGLEYANAEIVLTLSPFKPLAGLAPYILDGLGNDVVLVGDDATVDAANGTFTWTVAEAPWADGDELMLRVRAAPPR